MASYHSDQLLIIAKGISFFSKGDEMSRLIYATQKSFPKTRRIAISLSKKYFEANKNVG